ncbi:hypothetical protein LGR54_07840 [Ancylobacter sp. Lp-2]|uniref:hypothetical protein n=1 Tax=Ancylobacter sp. Lp-2 TaxID=2881339 RepID=UPI001E43A2C7|nr:hypothetical protein [Ancylobacter sp. Lp-2]MCB4768511.1 hypothetical protein [Ancylobacter sp. Lp-2]
MRCKGIPSLRHAAGAFAAGALLAAGALIAGASPAAAVVYCTGPGYPRGCVVRPAPAPAVRAAIYCTRPGYPVGCVANPNARAVARPGPGVNMGGPVNHPGLR